MSFHVFRVHLVSYFKMNTHMGTLVMGVVRSFIISCGLWREHGVLVRVDVVLLHW